MFEYCGVIHVHSTYSDGSGSIPEILNAAGQSQLDFLILTDHNSLKARAEGWEGWHGKTLLIVGDEVSGRRGHCLAIGTQQRVNHRQDHQGILQDIHRQNGLSFIAHPHGTYRPLLKERNHSWGNWAVDHFTGLELWSYMFDWVKDFKYYRFWNHYRYPSRYITGPNPQTLQKWDQICQQRTCVAIGGVDAHARKYTPLPFVVFPYESAFSTLHTRVLLKKPLSGSKKEDIQAILQALKQGHCYISYDGLAQGAGVRFQTTDGQISMGDEIPFQSPIEVNVQLPQTADLRIICNGETITQHQTKTHTFQATQPGVYRVEAHIHNSPWVYTNPIYLRAQ